MVKMASRAGLQPSRGPSGVALQSHAPRSGRSMLMRSRPPCPGCAIGCQPAIVPQRLDGRDRVGLERSSDEAYPLIDGGNIPGKIGPRPEKDAGDQPGRVEAFLYPLLRQLPFQSCPRETRNQCSAYCRQSSASTLSPARSASVARASHWVCFCTADPLTRAGAGRPPVEAELLERGLPKFGRGIGTRGLEGGMGLTDFLDWTGGASSDPAESTLPIAAMRGNSVAPCRDAWRCEATGHDAFSVDRKRGAPPHRAAGRVQAAARLRRPRPSSRERGRTGRNDRRSASGACRRECRRCP